MAKVVTMGEIMLRLSSAGNSRFVQCQQFDACYGGGEANVAVSLANYGHEAYFVSKVPVHEIGQCAVNALRRYGVHTDHVARGGNSAMQEALLLSSYCTSVTMVQNLPFFTGEKALADQINKTSNIKVMFNKLVVGLNGDDSLTSITLKDQNSNELETLETESIFVAIGQQANNQAFKNVCSLDEQGFIITDELCNSNVEGIYVAGDCRVKKIRQIVTATSDGSIAALQAIKYLDSKDL